MRNWLRAIFYALGGIFLISLLLYIGTLSPEVCSKLWIVSLASAALAAILLIGFCGNDKKE